MHGDEASPTYPRGRKEAHRGVRRDSEIWNLPVWHRRMMLDRRQLLFGGINRIKMAFPARRRLPSVLRSALSDGFFM
jgi:hypothetical protein